MIAGIPGAGINGLFYLLLTAWMPVQESGRTLLGRSTFSRWRAISMQVFLASGILLALGGEYWAIRRGFLFLHMHVTAGSALDQLALRGTSAVAPAFTIVPLVVLGSVVLIVQVLRVLLPVRATVPPRSLKKPQSVAPVTRS
jgi:hypothetical protein